MRDVGKNVESPKILQKETNGEGNPLFDSGKKTQLPFIIFTPRPPAE